MRTCSTRSPRSSETVSGTTIEAASEKSTSSSEDKVIGPSALPYGWMTESGDAGGSSVCRDRGGECSESSESIGKDGRGVT